MGWSIASPRSWREADRLGLIPMHARITRVVDAACIATPDVWDRQCDEHRRRLTAGIALRADGRVPASNPETPESARRFADLEIARYLAAKRRR